MTRRSLRAYLLPLLLVTLAACGPAASTDTATPSAGNGSSNAPDPLSVPAVKGDAGINHPPAGSSHPDGKSKPKEEALPPLGFRPSLLLMLHTPGSRDSEEIYGYDLATRQLGQLTDGGPGGAEVIAPSPDGGLFAYLRTEPGAPGNTAGVCTRPIAGGVPTCQWDRVGASLLWRPGTHDLYVREGSGLVVYKVETTGLSRAVAPPGVPYAGGFSPDGRWLTYADKGLVLVALEPGGHSVRFAGVNAGGGLWLAGDRLLVNDSDLESRVSKMVTVGLDGKVAPFPPLDRSPSRIQSIKADPTGRYVAINYGIQGGVYRHSGAAIYSLTRKEWQRIIAGDDTAWVNDWVAQGRLLLSHGEKQYMLHDPESGKQTPLPVQLKGHYFTSLSPDGDWLTFETDNTLALYQVSTGELRTVDTKGLKVVATVWVPQAKPQ